MAQGEALRHRRTSDLLTVGLRVAAVSTAAGTIAFLFIGDEWRAENIFLVPDLLLAGALCVAALQPTTRLYPALLGAFGLAAGVFATATADYLIQGRFGIGAALGLTTSLVASFVLLRLRLAPR